jgi:hypothetical protein
MDRAVLSISFLVLFLLPTEWNIASRVLHAQNPDSSTPARSVAAFGIQHSPPLIDGNLDENCWPQAERTSGFLQREPSEGASPTVQTEVMFCYDNEALYIGAIMHIDDPREVQSTLSRRDNAGNSARIIISLDTYHDRRTAYTYGVTADGVRFEYYHAEDREHSRDYSYDPVWEARVQRGNTAWTAEMRIPFSQLRFNEGETQLWGLNMNRYIPSRNEDLYWILIPKNETGWSSRFGTLTGIRGITPSSRIELTPYAAADLTLRKAQNAQDPFDKNTSWSGNAGLDFKAGLGPNLTLDATINPDFGQVEADPAEVNLSAYETYYSERRPFFIEGSQLLRGEGPDYFYSRRIGAPVHLSPQGQYSEQATNASILGAAKVTGRLASGLSIGALSAITEREFVDTYNPSTSRYGSELVEPLTGFGVLRLQQELGKDASTVGVILTGVQRDFTSPTGEDLLPRQAFSGGADWKIRSEYGGFELGGHAGFSQVKGSTAAIRRIQESSAHYFQRPDADHVELDAERTELTGYTFAVDLEKNSGEHWLWEIGAQAESPGFDINDAGRLQTADDIDSWLELQYRENTPGDIFHSYNVVLNASRGWNFGWINQFTSFGLAFNTTWKNFWGASLYLDYGLDAMSDQLTRGGPLMKSASGWNVGFSARNSYSQDLRWEGWLSRYGDRFGSWGYNIGGWVGLRTSGRLDINVTPGYTRSVNTRQYVRVSYDPAATNGARYVFSTIDRATLFAQFRINYAFSPDLTLEVYAEPFAASGKYLSFGELQTAGGEEIAIYGSDATSIIEHDEAQGIYTVTDARGTLSFADPDFNVLSFRSNIVLRWEWMRGSTLFLVWQQNRSHDDARGDIIGPLDLFRAFDTSGANFIALKLTYWLPLT